MAKELYFLFDDDSEMMLTFLPDEKHISLYITYRVIMGIDYILDIHSTEYAWVALYIFNDFNQLSTIMIMRWCKGSRSK